MVQIHILDAETIDKIAAGEVVERPASVVKELVENAIDAGAGAITVEARDGGIEFLRITDDGCGMEPSQIRTAFQRHATSKIKNAEDLAFVSSLGFRGEALSSIAAVSKVELITRTENTLTGIRYVMEGGTERSFEEIGAPAGTTFIMRNLFYNTPVRRKFLKQPATEGGYIAELMEHLALSRPDISFKFVLGNQIKFHTSGNRNLKEVIYRIYGRDIAAGLLPVQAEKSGIRIEGYLGKPVLLRSNRNFEIYFINGRFIKSQIIAKAIEEGYKEYLMQHKFPLCILHISMAGGEVDVNVHPTKMDVRFSDAPGFCNVLSGVIRDILQSKEMIPEVSLVAEQKGNMAEKRSKEEKHFKETEKLSVPEPFENIRATRHKVMEEGRYETDKSKMQDNMHNPMWNRISISPNVENISTIEGKNSNSGKQEKYLEEEPFFIEDMVEKHSMEKKRSMTEENSGEERKSFREGGEWFLAADSGDLPQQIIQQPQQMNFFEEKMLTEENRWRYRLIGQVFDTYWLVQFGDKLFIIDQHAAHEKIKYERLMKQLNEHEVLSQVLMPPIILTLTGQEESVLREHMETFRTLGFEIESFGGSEYTLRSVPVDLYGCREREMFLEVLDELREGSLRNNPTVVEEKIASMSCKAAVKGNNSLSREEAEALLDELLTLENPYHCPHGRPVIISMSKAEMEKKFKRII